MKTLDKVKQAIQGMGMNFGETAKKVSNILPPVQAYNTIKQITSPKFQGQVKQQLADTATSFVQSRPVQDFISTKQAVGKNIQGFSNLIKTSPKDYFNPEQAASGPNFWTSRPAQDLAKTQANLKRMSTFADEGFERVKAVPLKEYFLPTSTYFQNKVTGTPGIGQIPEKPRTETLNWKDKIINVHNDPTQLVPFLSSAMDIGELTKTLVAANKLRNGTASEEELLMLKDFIDKQNQDTTFGYKVLDVVSQIPTFAGELYLTGGTATVGRKAMKEGLEYLLTKGGKELVEKQLKKLAYKTVIEVGARSLQAPVAGATRIVANTLTNQIQSTLTVEDINDKESYLKSFAKAFGQQWVETLSEFSGGLFSIKYLPKAVRNKIIKSILFNLVSKLNLTKSSPEIVTLFKKVGYNGVISEMLEEQVGMIGHGTLEKLGLGDEEWRLPSGQELLVQLVSFSVPGVGAKIFDKGVSLMHHGITEAPVVPIPETEVIQQQLDQATEDIEQVGVNDTYKFQDENQEKLIHSTWNEKSFRVPGIRGPSLRHTLEGTGDIFREATNPKMEMGYVEEKLRRLDDFINNTSKTIDYESDSKNLAELRALWEKQPVKNQAEQIAKDLNLAIIDGDFEKANSLVEQIRNVKQQPAITKDIDITPATVNHSVVNTAYQQTVKNGGVTINSVGEQPTNGFSYSPYPQRTVVVPDVEYSRNILGEFWEKNNDLLSQPGHFVGTWKEAGEVHIDVVVVGSPTAETLQKAMDATQLAAFDLASLTGDWNGEITLGKREKGVYTANDEAINIFNQYTRENQGAGSGGGVGSIPEVPEGLSTGQTTAQTIGNEEVTPTELLSEIINIEDTEDFQLAMEALKNFRNYNADMYSTPVTVQTDEELGLETLAKYKGYKPVSMETIEQLTPEAVERINELNNIRAEFTNEIGNTEDVTRNYDFYTKRFGELMTKKEIISLRRELNKLVKGIDKEIGQLEKQTEQVERPVPTDEELAMQALERSRTPITEPLVETVTELADISKAPVELKEKFGKDIQEEMDVNSVTVQDENGELQEIDTGRGMLSRMINGTKGWTKDIQNKFAYWANSLSASFAGEIRVKESFMQYDSEGMDGIIAVQKGEKGYEDVRKFFDTWFNKLEAAGIPVSYWENYMPGVWEMWENSGKEIDKAFSRKVSKTPNFTKQKVFENYQQGIDAKLTPKYKTISQLAGYYERAAQIALANKNFFDYLIQNRYIVQDKKAPRSWKELDGQVFYKYEIKTNEGTYRGSYKASPELADAVNVTLSGARFPLLELTAKVQSVMKGIMLSAGIPGTGITFHTGSLLARYTNSANNPLGRALEGGWWALSPNAALNKIKIDPLLYEEHLKYGMTATVEDQGISMAAKEVQGNLVKKGIITVKNYQEKIFEHNIFKKIAPAMKFLFAQDTYKRLTAKGMEHEEAMRQSGALANEQFGGINTIQIGRNKDFQNFLRTILLASDWMETNVRLGTGVVKSLVPGKRSQLTAGQKMIYTRMVRNLILTTIIYSVIGKMLSDKWPWENEKGNEFNIDTGLYSSNGQKIYYRPYGTSIDWVRLPFEIAQAAKSGDFSVAGTTLKNRLAPFLSFGMAWVNDRDYAGNAIGFRGVDRYGRPMKWSDRAKGIANEVMSIILPAYVSSPISRLMGQQSLEQTISKSIELPLKFTGGAYTQSQKDQKDLMKSSGSSNEDVFNYFKGEKDKAKLDKEAKKIFAKDGEVGLDKWLSELFTKKTGEEKRTELIKAKYKFSDVTEKEVTGVVEKAKLEKEKLLLAKNIWNNSEEIPEMTDDEKTSLVKELGFKAEDIAYYSTASEENSIKFSFVEDLLSKTESSEKISTLAALRYEVGDKMILADDVINDLYDYGYITTAEKKYLKSIKWDKKKDTFSLKRKETGTKKVSMKIPSYKAPTLSKIKLPEHASFKNPIKRGALTSNIPKIPKVSTRTSYQMKSLTPSVVKNLVPLSLSQIGR